jgi:hypothetical protein
MIFSGIFFHRYELQNTAMMTEGTIPVYLYCPNAKRDVTKTCSGNYSIQGAKKRE